MRSAFDILSPLSVASERRALQLLVGTMTDVLTQRLQIQAAAASSDDVEARPATCVVLAGEVSVYEHWLKLGIAALRALPIQHEAQQTDTQGGACCFAAADAEPGQNQVAGAVTGAANDEVLRLLPAGRPEQLVAALRARSEGEVAQHTAALVAYFGPGHGA